MYVDCFYRALRTGSTNGVANKWSPKQVRSVTVEVHADAGLHNMLVAALANGASYGNGQTGIYEIQTDHGVWSGRVVDGHIRPLYTGTCQDTLRVCEKATFMTWDELADRDDAEEIASTGRLSCER